MAEALHKLEIGTALSAMASNFSTNALPMIGATVAAGVAGGLLDSLGRGGNSIGNFIIFFASIFATHTALRSRFGADPDVKPHVARAFGVNLLTGIGIFLGSILLIVPGLMLFTRWAIVVPAMMREDLGISASINRSAELTAGNRWAILGLGLIMWVPFIIVMVLVGGLAGAFFGEDALDGLAGGIAINALAALVAVLSAVLWVECYAMLAGAMRQEDMAEIFA